jgi:transposase
MRTISLDLRQRILSSYDQKEGTREEIAGRYRVSLGLVKKLLQQRRRTGDIAPRHHRSGRKPLILPTHHQTMRTLLSRQPDMTLGRTARGPWPCPARCPPSTTRWRSWG